MVIPCLQLRDEIATKIKLDIVRLREKGISPSFAIVQIGDNPASSAYIRVKTKKAEELGIKVKTYLFPKQATYDKLHTLILKLNNDPSIHGIIIQRPLPASFDENKLQNLIALSKDIDGLSPNSPFNNPLVRAVAHVINYVFSNSKIYNLSPKIYNLVVVGKGRTAGKPIFDCFSKNPNIRFSTMNYELITTQIDSQTPNPEKILKSADIIISCVGKERIIHADNIKKGVVLISVGQHQKPISNSEQKQVKMKWSGDYDEEEIKDIARAYTPTPGGIGPLNVIFLLKNVVLGIK